MFFTMGCLLPFFPLSKIPPLARQGHSIHHAPPHHLHNNLKEFFGSLVYFWFLSHPKIKNGLRSRLDRPAPDF
jgi:hypothetical protein